MYLVSEVPVNQFTVYLLRPQGVLPRFRTLVQVPVGARGELLSCEASRVKFKIFFSYLVGGCELV